MSKSAAPGPNTVLHQTVLRRIGSAITVAAVIALGLTASIVLTTPASAAPGDIEVKMAGESAFASSTPLPLLNMNELVPGGSATGTMEVRDVSGNAASSGLVDNLTLRMIRVNYSDTCLDSSCAGSGQALAHALTFTLTVAASNVAGIPAGTVLRNTSETISTLQAGVSLAANINDGDEVAVTLSGALPFAAGNQIQYGELAFDVQLELGTVSAESGATGQPGDSSQPDGPEGTEDSEGSDLGVLGTTSEAPPLAQQEVAPHPIKEPSVLVLGENADPLSYTGLPVLLIVTVGGSALALGLVLLIIGRRRSRI